MGLHRHISAAKADIGANNLIVGNTIFLGVGQFPRVAGDPCPPYSFLTWKPAHRHFLEVPMNRALNKSLLISSVAAVLGFGGLSGCVVREEAPPPTVTVSQAPPPAEPAPGEVVVQPAPPADQIEVIPPQPGPAFVWVGGYWFWDVGLGHYVWRNGYWGRPPYGHHFWVRDHWVRGPHGYVYVRGHWG